MLQPSLWQANIQSRRPPADAAIQNSAALREIDFRLFRFPVPNILFLPSPRQQVGARLIDRHPHDRRGSWDNVILKQIEGGS